MWRVGRGDGLVRGEVIEPTGNGGEERGRVRIGCSGDEGIELAMARGGANDVQCGPLGIPLVGDSCCGVLRMNGLRDVGVAGRAVGIKVGDREEQGRARIAAARPSNRGEGVGVKGGKDVMMEVLAMGLSNGKSGAVGRKNRVTAIVVRAGGDTTE